MDRIESLDGTLESYYRVLYERQKLRGKSDSQKRNYRIQLKHFADFLGRPATVDDLSDATIGDVMQWLVDKGRAPRTANKFRDLMCALWGFLARKRIERSDGTPLEFPDVEPMPESERTPVAWSKVQLQKLFAACDAQPGAIGGLPSDLFWHSLHALLWDTGERIRPIIFLEWGDVDLDERWVRIRAETRKGRKRDRTHRLSHETVAMLGRFGPRNPKDRVLPWPYRYDYLWHRYNRVLKSAGLPVTRDSKFHRMRKSVASWFEAAGGNATKLLDHSSRRITEKYLDPKIVTEQQACETLFRPTG